jgi:phosphoglycolate phosphatase
MLYNKNMDKFVIFDLDGTLINTLTGLTACVNLTFKKMGINYTYEKSVVRTFIGNGAKILFQRALKPFKEFEDKDYELFLECYEETQYVSEVYPEVEETLEKLQKKGYWLGVLSNKPDEILQKLIEKKLGHIDFKVVQGQDNKYPCKPNPKLLNEKIIDKFSLNTTNGYYVGDSYVDGELAQNANLKSIIVTYGYGERQAILDTKPDYLIDNFGEILNIVD